MRNKFYRSLFLLPFLLLACKGGRQKADLIVHNGLIYTVDSAFSQAEAFAVKDGKFLAIGKNDDIMAQFDAAEVIDVAGRPLYPGFFDAHCHFYAYGKMKEQAELRGSASFEEVISRLQKHAATHKDGWLLGRGWDHTLWPGQQYPNKDTLDKLFPNRPVVLSRVDGHAALVNQAALDAAHISANSQIAGGSIEKKAGRLTGILTDNAADSVKNIVPELERDAMEMALLNAQRDCFAVGLTTVDDAGLKKNVIDCMDQLQQEGRLKMRIYAMIEGSMENLDHYIPEGPFITNSLNVSSFKFYGDGSLGSRGACMLKPYSDQPGQSGFLIHDTAFYRKAAERVAHSAFQMNTHCIGDSANRFLLNIYANALAGDKTRRWRIEHAQVVDPADIPLFGRYGIIPSVQPTHATSDMRWAEDRLGAPRMPGAYAYRSLLEATGIIAAGSDFPVEGIDPLAGFYAAVVRKDKSGKPTAAFLPGQALSREQAMRAMTIWAAYANFEEDYKGSIEKGKLADFVILDRDIMSVNEQELTQTRVMATYLGGKPVYKR